MSLTFPKQAIILAAGFGTRLQPLTNRVPKPALPVGGVPVIWFNLLLLKQAGVRDVTINLYHKPAALRSILNPTLEKILGLKIKFSLEKKILGTAGGIAQALKKMDPNQACWILNGDIISDISLVNMAEQHVKQKAEATLAVVPRNRAQVNSYLYYDDQNRLWQIGTLLTLKKKYPKLTSGIFSGVHLIKPQLFFNYPPGQFGCVVKNIYSPLLREWTQSQSSPAPINIFRHRNAWWDVGKLTQLKEMDLKIWNKQAPSSILKLWEEAKKLATLHEIK